MNDFDRIVNSGNLELYRIVLPAHELFLKREKRAT